MADAKVKVLFNAARRYCIDCMEAVDSVARTLQGSPDAQTLEAWAGASMLNTILEEIERVVPDDFSTEDETRDYLLAAGQRAKVLGRREISGLGGEATVRDYEPNWDEAERAASERARAEYLTYIINLPVEQAAQAKPVLYRHLMSESKRRSVGKKLAKRWEADPVLHDWYPLWRWEEPLPPEVLALQDAYFYKEVGVETLQDILLHRGITRIWEINESRLDPEYELDPRLCSFRYGGPEMYWSSRELDWLVYVSHEASITFAGDWLINAIKKAWPNWEQRIYTGYDYEKPTDTSNQELM